MTDAAPTARASSALLGFEHRFATIDGVRLHYVMGGKPDGNVVVLFAGFPESWYAWRLIAPLLGKRYRVIAPDLPGQGDSDRPLSGYDTEALATAARGLLQQIGVTRYNIVGHDVGAWVAYPYAHLFGDEVQRLALLDAGIPGVTLPDAVPLAPDKAWRTWHFAFHTIPDLPETLLTGREREYLDWFLRRKTANPQIFADDDVAEYLRVFTKAGGLRAGLCRSQNVRSDGECNADRCQRSQRPVGSCGCDGTHTAGGGRGDRRDHPRAGEARAAGRAAPGRL